MGKKKDEKTNVLRILEREKIPHTAHFYEDTEGPNGTREYGVQVALALGEDVSRVFKTLLARGVSGAIYVFCVPVCQSLDFKKAAKTVEEKSIEMLPVAEICTVSGYIRGGCSPIGMKKPYLTVLHEDALNFETIYISAGKIGVQVELSPRDLIRLVGAKTANIIA